jgi:SAM-dependent methyltransferase
MSDWWQTYFEAAGWQQVQLGIDASFDDPAQTELVERALALDPGSHVLDVPAGTARIAIELATHGHHVTGIDLTERFLEVGRERAAVRGVEVDLRQGDLRALDLEPEVFDAALCFWGSFGYFDAAGDGAFVRGVAASLKPGGRFLIDTHTVESILPSFRERNWWEVEDILVLTATEYAAGTGRIETDWTIVGPAGRRERQRSSVRLYTLAELTALLEDAGFVSFEARDDDLEPFELGSHRLWLVATKG